MISMYGSGSDLSPIHLDNVICRGNESSLFDCQSNPVGQNNCDHSEDAGVKCGGMNSFIDYFGHTLSPYYAL